MFAFGVEQFFSYSPTTYVRAYGWGAAQFFAVPGVSNVLNLLELNDRTPFAVFRATAYDNYLEAGLDALSEASPWAAAITIAGFALVIPLRLLGLIGIVVAWRRRLFPELAIICAVVAYFAIIHLFVGNSRYRLPVEPLLLLLAVYGWQGVHQWWLNRSRDDRAQAE
jgi:CHASE2 domain-containing sensor protein